MSKLWKLWSIKIFGRGILYTMCECIHFNNTWQDYKITDCFSLCFLPDWYSGVLGLDPPGFGGVDSLSIDLQPGSDPPEPLLKHCGDHPIRCGTHIQEVVPSQSHSANQILEQEKDDKSGRDTSLITVFFLYTYLIKMTEKSSALLHLDQDSLENDCKIKAHLIVT